MIPQPQAALLDTNVLLLWLVGRTDPTLLATFKRVSDFEARDLVLLDTIVRTFQRMVTTPHVLSETSNFVNQTPSHRRAELVLGLRQFIDNRVEIYEPSKSLAGREEFVALGLTDAALAFLSASTVIITTDFHLSNRILGQSGHCLNFNHARAGYLLNSENEN